MSKIGNYLYKWRTEQRMTIRQLSYLLYCSESTIWKWENGVSEPTYYFIKSIKDLTGAEWEELF